MTITTYHNEEIRVGLSEFIQEFDMLLGCVAWLSHKSTIDQLKKKDATIVIQNGNINEHLSLQYRRISNGTNIKITNPSTQEFHDWGLREADWSGICLWGDAVGQNTQRIMHHKFLIGCNHVYKCHICNKKNDCRCTDDSLKEYVCSEPQALWTGSVNLTHNGLTRSKENVVLLRDSEVAWTYYLEFLKTIQEAETGYFIEPVLKQQQLTVDFCKFSINSP